MAFTDTSQSWILCLIFLWASASLVLANERSLFIVQNTTLQLSRGLPVGNSPGSKPGATVVVERVHIHGLSRFKNLGKFAHSVKVKVLPAKSNVRLPNIEICFHRNASLVMGMCSQGQWEKVVKGSWVRSMSPFDHKLLDIRTLGSTLENFEVSAEEEFFAYRIVLLILGITLMSSASFLSQSLAFYYSSAMAIGIILVILIILYQGMKLLPTGRRSSLAIFLYSSAIGLGTFLLRYIPGLVRSILTELGIDEDMYNPLAIFLLTFVAIAGAWLGFWVVKKLVLTEEGSVDISTAQFVAWAIRILAAIMILQSSMDPLLGTSALLCGSLFPSLKRILRLRFARRLRRHLFKSPKKNRRRSQVYNSSPFDDEDDEDIDYIEDSTLYRPQQKSSPMTTCKSSERGFNRSLPKMLTEELYPSIIHTTPERRKYSPAEWNAFTKKSTEKALEELVASPDFGKWLSSNADRISVTPNSETDRRRRWLWS
ncbi:transmembrane protein [Trifolium repens]|nr:transmembrane protein [Trifolium repens]